MEDRDYQDISLPVKVNVGSPIPCAFAKIGRYKKSLILLCSEGKGIKVPNGIPGFEEGYLCCATCFKEDRHITPESYLDTSRMQDCIYVQNHTSE
jgi:hypothetical protein